MLYEVITRKFKNSSNENKQTLLRNDFFNALYKNTQGNIKLALLFWKMAVAFLCFFEISNSSSPESDSSVTSIGERRRFASTLNQQSKTKHHENNRDNPPFVITSYSIHYTKLYEKGEINDHFKAEDI